MNGTNNKGLDYVVSKTILEMEGIFTLGEIIQKIKDSIEGLKENIDSLHNYVLRKLESMCDLGLIGRTDIYYFSI